ncbi:GNAT family N-acetyltransferase [Streptomyces sp. SID2563]|uniref:GNAT family N-acetyltransferase n=1 Tax=Streptomyces sp. SID2563 TaxID=2690255 RepID=UPI00136E354E|nr:GNAT family N-acetyltransferase [Streptomyces sp. SID2563]MYW07981.1 GNAT family N-acetyltransferase [Streptomyces sp. SID2563]
MRDTLPTPRLILRRLRLEDAPALHELFSDPETHTIGTGPVASLAGTEEWIARRSAFHAETGLVWYGVWLRDGGPLVGNCGIFAGRTGRAEPEIGYEVRRSYQGRGLAAEAARAVLGECDGAGIARVWATVRPRNAASLAVAARLGLVHAYTRTDERGELLYLSRPRPHGTQALTTPGSS